MLTEIRVLRVRANRRSSAGHRPCRATSSMHPRPPRRPPRSVPVETPAWAGAYRRPLRRGRLAESGPPGGAGCDCGASAALAEPESRTVVGSPNPDLRAAQGVQVGLVRIELTTSSLSGPPVRTHANRRERWRRSGVVTDRVRTRTNVPARAKNARRTRLGACTTGSRHPSESEPDRSEGVFYASRAAVISAGPRLRCCA